MRKRTRKRMIFPVKKRVAREKMAESMDYLPHLRITRRSCANHFIVVKKNGLIKAICFFIHIIFDSGVYPMVEEVF